MHCEECGHAWTGPGYDNEVNATCPSCGSYRTQPSPTHSEMEMRNMPAPGEEDMGGNPLKEGILADGGWQNRMKRDESFASVRTADYDDDLWDDDEGENPYQGYSNEDAQVHGVKDRFLIDSGGNVYHGQNDDGSVPFHEDIARQHGIANHLVGHTAGQIDHQGNVKYLSHQTPFDALQLSAILQPHYGDVNYPTDVQSQSEEERWQNEIQNAQAQQPAQRELETLYGPPKQRSWGRPMDRNEGLVRGGSTRDKLYLPWSLDTEKIAADFEVEEVIPDVDDVEEIPGVENPDDKKTKKKAFVQALALGAARFLAPRVLGAAVGRAVMGGGGQQEAQPALNQPAQTQQSWDTLSSVHAQLKRGYDHPSSNPGFDDTDDPEDVDQHEVNDGSHDEWQKDQDVNEGGTDAFAPEVMEALQQAEPALLHYMNSDESGADDPAIAHLLELLQQHHPDIAEMAHNGEPDTEAEQALDELLHGSQDDSQIPPAKTAAPMQGVPGIGGIPAPGTQQLQQAGPGNMVNPATQASCPHCGARITPGSGMCPQCNGAVSAGPQQNASPAAVPQPPVGPAPQGMPVMAANQGPHNPEQFQAVAEYLKQQGRDELIPDLIEHPENYGDILAEIQGKDQPPNPDPDAGPAPMPDPSQMGQAPPGAPGAMPQPGGMPTMAAADPVTPPCPKCDSHTTGMVTDNGQAQCSNCNHKWQTDVDIQGEKTPVQPKASAFEHDELHPHPVGVPSADQTRPDDPEKDDNPGGQWATQDGQPLTVGQEYEMYSAKYDVPDVVRIEAVKPDSIEYTLTGEYGLEHRTEVSKEEAEMDGLTFVPTDSPDGEPQQNLNEQQPPDQMAAPVEDSHEFQLRARTAAIPCPHCKMGPVENGVCWTCGQKVDPWGDTNDTRPDYGQPANSVPPPGRTFAHIAGKRFTPMEQREFIDEPGKARNADKLDLEGTHYIESRQLELSDDLFLFGL